VRVAKEIAFLILIALIGIFAAGWCVYLFGAKPTGILLRYGGLIVSGFLFAARLLNTAFSNAEQLAQFDVTTRNDYLSALRIFKRRFNRRFLCGLFVGAISVATGTILAEAEGLQRAVQILLAGIGGAGLTTGAGLVAAQLLAASWPAEFLASAKQIARDDQARASQLARYTHDDSPRIVD
jgi:hypothetical protein